MLFLKLYRFLCGYVRFAARGEFPERLLNVFAGQYITVWNVLRHEGVLYANMSVKDYKKIRRLRRQTQVRTRIQQKYGFPFFIRKYKKRAGFALGAVLFLVLLKVCSMFVWNIEVCGNQRVSTEEILAVAHTLGVREGALRTGLDTDAIRTRLALQVEDIAWAAINIEGVKVTIDITETKEVPRQEEKPCNLVAALEGQILAVEVTEGKLLVAPGDVVVKGDLLASGVVEYADKTTAFKRAAGRVIAQTRRTQEVFIPFTQTETLKTGKVTKRHVLSFFGLELPLYLGSVKGEYQKEVSASYIRHEEMYLPIYLQTAVFRQTVTRTGTVDARTAELMAREAMTARETESFAEIEILGYTDDLQVQAEGVLLRRSYICKENIAMEEILSINTTNS